MYYKTTLQETERKGLVNILFLPG